MPGNAARLIAAALCPGRLQGQTRGGEQDQANICAISDLLADRDLRERMRAATSSKELYGFDPRDADEWNIPVVEFGFSDRLAVLRRNKIGFVFQSFQLLGNLTARENVLWPDT